MTPSQLTTFKAAILADANLTTQVANKDATAIAAYYNGVGSGNIWRPVITTAELNTAIVWSEFAVLSSLLQSTYMALIATGSIDATSANIRGGFTTVFGSGTTSRANLIALAQRVATKFEALFTNANVCALFGYQVTVADVGAALGS